MLKVENFKAELDYFLIFSTIIALEGFQTNQNNSNDNFYMSNKLNALEDVERMCFENTVFTNLLLFPRSESLDRCRHWTDPDNGLPTQKRSSI